MRPADKSPMSSAAPTTPGSTIAQLALRVEEVRDHAGAGLGGRSNGFIGRVRMADADYDAASLSRVIWLSVTVSGATVIKRFGKPARASTSAEQVGLVHRAGSASDRARPCARRSDAALRDGARESPATPCGCVAPRRDRATRLLGRIGDEGRQGNLSCRTAQPVAQMVSIGGTLGSRLNCAPPAPFTCRSTNPGARMPPPIDTRCASVGESCRDQLPSTTPSLTTTPDRSCQLSPSKTARAHIGNPAHTVSAGCGRASPAQ